MIGLISLLLGVLLVLFRGVVAANIIQQQNKFWGFNFSQNAIAAAQGVCATVGFALIIIGILSVFQIIRFK